MINPAEIKAKAEKRYLSYLQSVIEGVPFVEIIITGNKKPSKILAKFEEELMELKSQSKEKKGYGYTIKYQTINKKDIGTQDLPTEISFQTETDFLKYLGKEKEVSSFRENIQTILSLFPELKKWLSKHPQKVIENQEKWNELLKVCSYFKSNPKPDLYIRELPIQVHTKFIENNKGVFKELLDIIVAEHINSNETNFEKRFNLKYDESKVRFRILDKQIAQKYFSGIEDLSILIHKFRKLNLPLEKVFVVENKMNMLTFPTVENSIVIFGSGYGVENMKDAEILKTAELFYWGDLDEQGFEILSQFRGYFPHTQSILMDKETFEKYVENDKGTPSKIAIQLNLTDEEQKLYEQLNENNWRLEQEKIPQEYVNDVINSKLKRE